MVQCVDSYGAVQSAWSDGLVPHSSTLDKIGLASTQRTCLTLSSIWMPFGVRAGASFNCSQVELHVHTHWPITSPRPMNITRLLIHIHHQTSSKTHMAFFLPSFLINKKIHAITHDVQFYGIYIFHQFHRCWQYTPLMHS